MQSVGEQLGKSNIEAFRSHPSLVTSDAIGVELELEGWTSSAIEAAGRALHPLWSVTSDGSLRNGGVEFITSGGLGGETLHQAFERMTALLARVNYDASWRCSTHMHINMLDFTVNQVARFLMVYAACEPVLFKHCGQFRRSSNFCTPVGDSLPFHKKLIARLWDDVVATRAASQSTNKYTALNLQPLFGNDRQRALGTVEFRGGRPMTSLDEFVLQANLLLSIKQFVRTFDGNEEAMLTRLNDGVFNTVYANGCAASLEVPSQELDDSLIHAWLLLKSYQQGMTRKPKSRSEQVDEMLRDIPAGFTNTRNPYAQWTGVGATTAVEGPAPRANQAVMLSDGELDRAGYYSPHRAAHPSDEQIGQYIPADIARKMARYMQELCDRELSEHHRSQYINVALTDERLGAMRCSSDDASKFILGYCLHVADNYLRRPEHRTMSPVAPMQRMMEARALGLHPCILISHPPSRQPILNLTSGYHLDYRVAINDPRLWNDLLRSIGFMGIVHGNKDMFDYLATAQVRVHGSAAIRVNARLTELGATTGIQDVTIQAVYLKYLLKLAGVSSADVVQAEDLPTYDRVCRIVDVLQGVGCNVPVYKSHHRTTAAPHGIMRIESNPYAGIGIGISSNRAQQPDARTSRVSATTGLEVK